MLWNEIKIILKQILQVIYTAIYLALFAPRPCTVYKSLSNVRMEKKMRKLNAPLKQRISIITILLIKISRKID